MRKRVGWLDHKWALAFFAGIVACIFMLMHINNEANIFNIMSFIPDIIWYVVLFVTTITSIVIFIRHIFFTKKELSRYDSVEKYLLIYLSIVFAVCFFDQIILDLSSKAYIAYIAEKRPDGFIETIFYLIIKSRKIWIKGIIGTLELSLFGTAFGFILAILLVFMRIQEPNPRDSENMQLLKLIGSTFVKLYVTVIRGTPMMVQVFIIYYGGFNVVRWLFPTYSIAQLNGIYGFFTAGLVTVTLNTTAYIEEILRGGIESIDKGQTEASRSLGLNAWQTMMKVVFPQAVKNSIPSIGNEFIINIKDTSVLNVIGVFELMFATTTTASTYYQYLPTYVIAAIIYLCLTLVLTRVLDWIGKKLDAPANKGLPSSN